MAKSSPHPFPVLQVLAPGLLSSEVLIGLEKALVKLEIAYTKVEQRFLLGRELELFAVSYTHLTLPTNREV